MAYGTSGYYPLFNTFYPTYPQNNMPNQSYAQQPAQPQNPNAMIWVDGEVGAKAYQMPPGMAPGTPIALWDTNDTVIYLKSMNQMGMPNPLQKIHYTMEENQNVSMLPAAPAVPENYATKDDLEAMKNEIKELLRQNQNGSNQNQNRGGNR